MLKVKKSPIHGKGLFSTKAIQKGELIGKCKVVKTDAFNAYTLWVGKKTYEMVCKFKYINHSDKPNIVIYDDLTVETVKKIKPGDELTHKYE